MRRINALIEQYEVLNLKEKNTDDTAILIYAELIEMGMTPDEIMDECILGDYLMIDCKYEFSCEEVVEDLCDELYVVAVLDLYSADYEEEETEEIPDFKYIVSVVNVGLVEGTKDTGVIATVYNSLETVRDYVDVLGATEAVKHLLTDDGMDTGTTGLLAVEDITDLFMEMGAEGETVVEQIPEGAVAVHAIVTTNKDRTKMLNAELFVVFEANEM